jgi:hypothetical protein
MSLFSYLNMDASASTSSSLSPQLAQALQTVAQKNAAKATGAVGGSSGSSSVSITLEAKRAAAAKADADKSPTALAGELRASLNGQYKTGGKNSADLTVLSGRALATIALNESNQFSRAEIAAAKLELRARDRQSALAAISSGPLTSTSLSTYMRDMIATRSLMSSEEQQLREANPNLR